MLIEVKSDFIPEAQHAEKTQRTPADNFDFTP